MPLVFLLFILFLLNLLMEWRLFVLFRKYKEKSSKNTLLKTSVIISARNEENTIENTILPLLEQPDFISEIIVVDDYSDDNTSRKLMDISDPAHKLKIYKNEMSPGKKSALTTGINKAENEFILITDADCIPQKKWALSFAEKFAAGFDMLFGITPYRINNSFVSKISGFENLRASIISFSALSHKLPYTAAARSFGFTKSAFKKISGYENTMEVPFGDDDLLIREAAKNKLKIGCVLNELSFVYTNPKNNFKEYFEQKKRHTGSSFYYSPKIKFMLAVWHIFNLLPLIILPFFLYDFVYAIPLLVKLFFDYVILKLFQHRFGYNFNSFQLIYLQITYEVFIVVHFLNALRGDVKWKEPAEFPK